MSGRPERAIAASTLRKMPMLTAYEPARKLSCLEPISSPSVHMHDGWSAVAASSIGALLRIRPVTPASTVKRCGMRVTKP